MILILLQLFADVVPKTAGKTVLPVCAAGLIPGPFYCEGLLHLVMDSQIVFALSLRKLPCAVYWREGLWLQRFHIPSCDHTVHVPGILLIHTLLCVLPSISLGHPPRVVTSLVETAQEASPSTEKSLQMRTSS